MMMKPYKIFLTFLTILALIAFISYLFPPGGIGITSDLTLNFPSWKQLISYDKSEYKDISKIIQNNAPLDTIAPTITDSIAVKPEADTLLPKKDSTDSSAVYSSKQRKKTKPKASKNDIQYPDNDPSVLYPFFRSLSQLQNNKELIRILHYGDSQIEGDRISSYIRNQLQKHFGGAGVGLFPVVLPHNTNISLKHSLSRNWKRYTLRDAAKANFRHRRFGLLMSFSRFSPYYSHYQDEVYKAWVSVKSSPLTFDLTSEFTQCRIFYGYNEKPFIVKMDYGEQTADADMVPASSSMKTMKWDIPATIEQFTIEFQGNHSPDIYGIALDGNQGIALDNIALRGSSGTEFTSSDISFMKTMLEKLNAKLIIMHFGVNLVPVIRNNYDFYEEKFYKQLKLFKSFDKDLSIIVMGVTDMSRKEQGQYESYPNITDIRNAQKRAAFRAGCAFWDTFQAMGGKNSMPSWVFSEPPLARKDFTHFTYKGSVVISKMFYKALMQDYRLYKQHSEQEQILSSKENSP